MSHIDHTLKKLEVDEKSHTEQLHHMIIELKSLLTEVKQSTRKPKFNDTRMLKKNEVLERLGVSPTNPIKNEIFATLPTYDNKFSKQAIFKEEDVLELIHTFPVMNQGNLTTTP